MATKIDSRNISVAATTSVQATVSTQREAALIVLEDTVLDEKMLEALGKRLDAEKRTAPAIHNDLCLRWKEILKEDNAWLLSESDTGYLNNLNQTSKLLGSLGFIINEEKSQMRPMTECRFLGFKLNSVKMEIELPDSKKYTG
ncbi:hypothetical protein M0804_009045 [Polistes exclamans]|nr:hypothetical protein M0804_009045 [Polistes exclamans]